MACVIAAPASGHGKTLVSLCLTALIRSRGRTIQTFKVGPDYLDAQWLGRISDRSCRNLDPVLCGADWLRRAYRHWGGRADHALVEGVMGLFDGVGATREGSTAAVAALLALPVVLVVDASRQAGSVAALVRGFREHGAPEVSLAGVILNRVGSLRHERVLREALAGIGADVLGALPRDGELDLPSRHLGLRAAHEAPDLARRRRVWADLARRWLDLDRLLPMLEPPHPADGARDDPIRRCLRLPRLPESAESAEPRRPAVTVAVAADEAFHFRYPEACELLGALGGIVRPWRPLHDEALPAGSAAIVLPGGYPELHGAVLSRAARAMAALRQARRLGMPIYAECGGLMVLADALVDGEGREHAMAGLLPVRAERGALSVGYRRLQARGSALVLAHGDRLAGHELHRWHLVASPPSAPGARDHPAPLWRAEGWGVAPRAEGWGGRSLHASWIHLHWAGCPDVPRRLCRAARRFLASMPPAPCPAP